MALHNPDAGKLKTELQEFGQWLSQLYAKRQESPEDSPLNDSEIRLRLTSDSGATVSFGAESATRYWEFRAKLYRLLSGKNEAASSLDYLDGLLRAAIFEVIDLGSAAATPFEARLKSAIDQLLVELRRTPKSWQCTVRIYGVTTTGLPLQFGKVQFLEGDAAELQLFHSLADNIPTDPDSFWADGRTFQERWHQDLNKEFDGQVLARVEVQAVDKTAAREFAITEIQRTLDMVNFFAGFIPIGGLWAYLAGNATPATMLVVSTTQGETTNMSRMASGLNSEIFIAPAGVYSDFSLAAWASVATPYGWNVVHNLLNRTQRDSDKSRFLDEQRVLTACAWAGRATTPRRMEEAFLFYAMAFETLLMGGSYHDMVTYRVKTRGAWLLGHDFEGRKTLEKAIGVLYDTRSKIVHQGQLQVTAQQLEEMRYLCRSAIVRLLTMEGWWQVPPPESSNDADGNETIVAGHETVNNLPQQPSLDSWFEDQLLGSPSLVNSNGD